MAVDHYENFPVASLLLPAALREPVAALYAFARSADDFADEGNLTARQRQGLLDHYRSELDAIAKNLLTTHPVFLRLRPVIAKHQLPLQLFHDLLDAFSQDLHKDRYANAGELMDYCRRSANPVGRLMLHLFDAASVENCRRSDAICSALQLINHWQDVGIDIAKGPNGRVYLPQDEMARFGVTDQDLSARNCTPAFRDLLRFEVEQARELMLTGESLGWDLPGRMGLEIRAIIAGGLRILNKIDARHYDVFNRRPTLNALDGLLVLSRTLVRPL